MTDWFLIVVLCHPGDVVNQVLIDGNGRTRYPKAHLERQAVRHGVPQCSVDRESKTDVIPKAEWTFADPSSPSQQVQPNGTLLVKCVAPDTERLKGKRDRRCSAFF